MVALSEIDAELSALKSAEPGLVAVFVGGSSGIGEATARAFVQHAPKPHVYLVGRNKAQADVITKDLELSNPDAKVRFIQSDVSLLRNVDKVCDEIKSAETQVNLLFLSAGILTMAGRNETSEGLDMKLSLHYYSRLRFTHNLLPLLNRAAQNESASKDQQAKTKPLARVISVLGAGLEAKIDTSDLSLKRHFSLSNCANHAITMTSLSFYKLASSNPSVTFIHTQPGGVKTNITRGLNPLIATGLKLLTYIPLPFIMTAEESGRRHAWAATTPLFASGGLRLLGPKGETNDSKIFEASKSDEETINKVLSHTDKVFSAICTDQNGRYIED